MLEPDDNGSDTRRVILGKAPAPVGSGGDMAGNRGLRDEIDRSIGSGPHGVPVDELLAQGHRALFRRRLLAGTGATLAAVAIFGTATVMGSGSGTHVSPAPGFAGQPSASPATPTTAPDPALRTPSQREAARAARLPLAEFNDRGRLVLAPRTQVVQRIDNPFASSGPGNSVALELDYRRVRYWFVLHQAPDLSHWQTSYTWSGEYDGSFTSWVDEQRALADSAPTAGAAQDEWPGIPGLDLVRFVGTTDQLEPVVGVTILSQQASVSVGESFSGPGDQTAAAKVETTDGERYYVIARRVPGGAPQYIAVTEAEGGPTLTSFLELARTRYADNGGGLL